MLVKKQVSERIHSTFENAISGSVGDISVSGWYMPQHCGWTVQPCSLASLVLYPLNSGILFRCNVIEIIISKMSSGKGDHLMSKDILQCFTGWHLQLFRTPAPLNTGILYWKFSCLLIRQLREHLRVIFLFHGSVSVKNSEQHGKWMNIYQSILRWNASQSGITLSCLLPV